MIFIGTTNLTRNRGAGQFYCPACGHDQSYRLRSRRPFLTVYFIPLVPIGDAHPFVQCNGCNHRWDPTVLQLRNREHPTVPRSQFEDEALRAAILVTLAKDDTLGSDEISESEIQCLLRIASHLAGEKIDREVLGLHCSIARENAIKVIHYVTTVSIRWNAEQSAEALGAMFLAASSGGEMDADKTEILTAMRDILNMSDEQYHVAIEDALQWGENQVE